MTNIYSPPDYRLFTLLDFLPRLYICFFIGKSEVWALQANIQHEFAISLYSFTECRKVQQKHENFVPVWLTFFLPLSPDINSLLAMLYELLILSITLKLLWELDSEWSDELFNNS